MSVSNGHCLTSLDGYSNIFSEAESAYENGDLDKAINLFLRLANAGVPDACMYLGMIYKAGDGVPVDEMVSRTWYSKYVFLLNNLVRGGDVKAALELGKLYQYGNIVEKNENKAISLIRKSAESGYSEAQFHLANQYRYGWTGCNRSESDFDFWLERAVINKHPEAMFTKGMTCVSDESKKEEGMLLIMEAAKRGFWLAKDWLQEHQKGQKQQ